MGVILSLFNVPLLIWCFQKKVATAAPERVGLGSRPKQQGKEYAYYNRSERLKQAFDVSNKALIASFVFWLVIMYSFYMLGGYGLIALRVMLDEADLDGVRYECQLMCFQSPVCNIIWLGTHWGGVNRERWDKG